MHPDLRSETAVAGITLETLARPYNRTRAVRHNGRLIGWLRSGGFGHVFAPLDEAYDEERFTDLWTGPELRAYLAGWAAEHVAS